MAIYKRTSLAALASATSTNGTDRNGTSLSLELADVRTLSVQAQANITTSLVVATFKLQVSMDNSTFFDLKLPNNAANVATAAGTGSEVVTRVALPALGEALGGWMYFRCVATLSGAATAAADLTAVTYRYVQPGGIAY